MKLMVNNFHFRKFWYCEINIDIVLSYIVDARGFVYYSIVPEVLSEILDVMLVDHVVGFSYIP